MSRMKQFQTFLPNKGQAANVPEEFLLDQFSPSSRNMEFVNQLLQGRAGLAKFDTALLSGPILNIDLYKKHDGTFFLMFCTNKDIYAYDFGNTRFDILSKTYTTGTIEILAGSLDTVTGSGTTWSSNLKAGDYIKIGAGSIHTGSTWYEIQSVDSNTQLTLTGNAVATPAGTAYVGRKIFNGGTTDFWDSENFDDTNLGRIWVATNGVDTPVYYNGTGQVVDVTGFPGSMTTARYVDVMSQRLLWLWTVEGGSNQTQRNRWSDVANIVSYQANGFVDLVDEASEITGSVKFAGYHIIFKEDSAYLGRHIGGTAIFDYSEKSSTAEGCLSNKSIIARKDYIYYYGLDKKFHRWNLVRDEIISEGIFPETKEFNPNLEKYIYGWNVVRKNQIRWFCPLLDDTYNDYCFVWDYQENIPEVWKYESAQAICSIGEFINETDLYVDDPIWGEYFLDEQVGFWDDSSLQGTAPVIIYGGYDKYVRTADVNTDDDGNTYTRTFESNRQNFKKPHLNKRLHKEQYWFESEPSGTVTVSKKKDDNSTYDAATKSISLVDASKDIVKQNATWDKRAENFKTKIEATNHFSLLGWISFLHLKRNTR